MRFDVLKTNFMLWVARHLIPKRLRYWCVIVAAADATTGEYSNTVVPELSMVDMIKRVG